MNYALLPVLIILSYLLGAVPFGLMFSKLFSDVDVRTIGSGNIGATNVLRAAGKKAAVLTLLADALKGLIPVLVVNTILQNDAVTALSGAAAVLGHVFPIYLKFKGGKGVATSYGVDRARLSHCLGSCRVHLALFIALRAHFVCLLPRADFF